MYIEQATPSPRPRPSVPRRSSQPEALATDSRQASRPVDGRAALLRVTSGTLDGVPVTVANTVTNKDACTYDLNYIAPATAFDAGMAAYQAVVDGFVATR